MKQDNIKIESNIPIPANREHLNRRYPLGEMKRGDSFFVNQSDRELDSVRSAVSYYGIRHPGYKFSVRKIREGEVTGTRVWRI